MSAWHWLPWQWLPRQWLLWQWLNTKICQSLQLQLSSTEIESCRLAALWTCCWLGLGLFPYIRSDLVLYMKNVEAKMICTLSNPQNPCCKLVFVCYIQFGCIVIGSPVWILIMHITLVLVFSLFGCVNCNYLASFSTRGSGNLPHVLSTCCGCFTACLSLGRGNSPSGCPFTIPGQNPCTSIPSTSESMYSV